MSPRFPPGPAAGGDDRLPAGRVPVPRRLPRRPGPLRLEAPGGDPLGHRRGAPTLHPPLTHLGGPRTQTEAQLGFYIRSAT